MDKAKLIIGNDTHELDIIEGSEGEKAIDITSLRSDTGLITSDLGYKSTGATRSAITFLNGEKGILRYRGYPIEQLAEKASFLEVAYLLIYGELPNTDQKEFFEDSITHHTLVHEDLRRIFEAFPTGAHPMGVLSSMIASLSTYYPEAQNPNRSVEAIDLTMHRLVAKIPTS